MSCHHGTSARIHHAPSSSNGFKGPTHASKKRLGGHSCHTAKVFHAMSSPATGWAAFVEYPTMVYLKASWSKIQTPPQKKKGGIKK